jgi:hypothetical protein
MQKIMANVNELAKNASPAELVANIILDAASNPNPRLRYLAGKDVESWAAGKKNMDELEFFNMIKKLYPQHDKMMIMPHRNSFSEI